MVRIQHKGGVWTNAEDEVLKAGVMMYGQNQWGRIASLLVRKSSKQCKARWYEWLDPSVRKTEWSREEEEKLLHLAKLFPSQWRTIAPLVGRTAAQCLAHYEKLLDSATGGTGEDAANDPRKLRPGEVDPNPESKPAKPDAVDMDDDMREMLSEARARLANTRGKKAKRKAREKELEESRRLAKTQKARELRRAGISATVADDETSRRKKRAKKGEEAEIDLLKEVPFHRVAPVGLHSVEEEKAVSEKMRLVMEGKGKGQSFKEMALSELDGTRLEALAVKARAKETKKLRDKMKEDMPAALAKVAKLTGGAKRKRSELVLPAPEMTEAELESIATHVTQASEAEAAAAAQISSDGRATSALLARYDVPLPSAVGATPRTPLAGSGAVAGGATPVSGPGISRREAILAEARAQHVRTTAAAPLLGKRAGDVDVDDPESTPTPTLPSSSSHSTSTATPQHNLATPRDALAINNPTPVPVAHPVLSGAGTGEVRAALSRLPAPAKKYEIALPDTVTAALEASEAATNATGPAIPMDAEEVDAARQETRERVARIRKSQALSRNLPRPPLPPVPSNYKDDAIAAGAAALMLAEHVQVPFSGGAILRKKDAVVAAQKSIESEDALFQVTLTPTGAICPGADRVEAARKMIDEEAGEADDATVKAILAARDAARPSLSEDAERTRLLAQYSATQDQIKSLEQRCLVHLKGYVARADRIYSDIASQFESLAKLSIDYAAFDSLAVDEAAGGAIRVEQLSQEVAALQTREQKLQNQYRELAEKAAHV